MKKVKNVINKQMTTHAIEFINNSEIKEITADRTHYSGVYNFSGILVKDDVEYKFTFDNQEGYRHESYEKYSFNGGKHQHYKLKAWVKDSEHGTWKDNVIHMVYDCQYTSVTKYDSDTGKPYESYESRMLETSEVVEICDVFFDLFRPELEGAAKKMEDGIKNRHINARKKLLEDCDVKAVLGDLKKAFDEHCSEDINPDDYPMESFLKGMWGNLGHYDEDDNYIEEENPTKDMSLDEVLEYWVENGGCPNKNDIRVQCTIDNRVGDKLFYFDIEPSNGYAYSSVEKAMEKQGYGFSYSVPRVTTSYGGRYEYKWSKDTNSAKWSTCFNRIEKSMPDVFRMVYQDNNKAKLLEADEPHCAQVITELSGECSKMENCVAVDCDDYHDRPHAWCTIEYKGLEFDARVVEGASEVTVRDHDVQVKHIHTFLDALIDRNKKADEISKKNDSQIDTLESLKSSLEKQIEGLEEQISTLRRSASQDAYAVKVADWTK